MSYRSFSIVVGIKVWVEIRVRVRVRAGFGIEIGFSVGGLDTIKILSMYLFSSFNSLAPFANSLYVQIKNNLEKKPALCYNSSSNLITSRIAFFARSGWPSLFIFFDITYDIIQK